MKKIILKANFILFLMLMFVGFSHAFVFPQETRCILIDFHQFENEGDLYYRSGISPDIKVELQNIIKQAEVRVSDFWKGRTSQPKFIYCENSEDYKKFGSDFSSPAVTHMKLGTYVVISKDGIDLDIIAHEISHTELFQRVGFFNRSFEIPTWFDEGLAMQVDYRHYYSTKALKEKTNNLAKMPDVTKMCTYNEFGRGSKEDMNAKLCSSEICSRRMVFKRKTG